MRLHILHVPDCPNVALLEERISKALNGNRVTFTLTRQMVGSPEEAAAVGMAGSPTLLVDGIDPFTGPDRPPSVSCRLYRSEYGQADGAPSVAALRQALGSATDTNA